MYIKKNLQMCKLCVCRIVTAARATRTEQATKANPTAEAATATRTEAAKAGIPNLAEFGRKPASDSAQIPKN